MGKDQSCGESLFKCFKGSVALIREMPGGTLAVSHINLEQNNVQLLTPHLSPYLNTDSLLIHGFPSFIQQSSSEQPSAHSLRSSCPTQMPLDLYLRNPQTYKWMT